MQCTDSRRELSNRLQQRLAKVTQPLPLQSSVEGDANIGASQSKFDGIALVNLRILGGFQLAINQHM